MSALVFSGAALSSRATSSRRLSRAGVARARARASRVRRAAWWTPSATRSSVTGCKERVAQCSVDQLSKNERSAGTIVKVALPASCYQGVRNPLDAMAKDLLPPGPTHDRLPLRARRRRASISPPAEYEGCLADATGVILANEYAPDLLAATRDFLAAVDAGKCPKLRRVVLLKDGGVRLETPTRRMNRKTKVGTGIIGGEAKDGGAPLDKWLEAEEMLRAAATASEECAWTYTVVSSLGDLRGNGPTSVTYGDAMLTLVDNAFDVRMQDIEMEEGGVRGGRND